MKTKKQKVSPSNNPEKHNTPFVRRGTMDAVLLDDEVRKTIEKFINRHNGKDREEAKEGLKLFIDTL
jgi:hypothetical protein